MLLFTRKMGAGNNAKALKNGDLYPDCQPRILPVQSPNSARSNKKTPILGVFFIAKLLVSCG